MTHAAALLKRQAYHSRERKRAEDKLYANELRYKSSFTGQQGTDDEIAKKSLSSYAYKELFIPALKASAKFQNFLITMEIVMYDLWAMQKMMITVQSLRHRIDATVLKILHSSTNVNMKYAWIPSLIYISMQVGG